MVEQRFDQCAVVAVGGPESREFEGSAQTRPFQGFVSGPPRYKGLQSHLQLVHPMCWARAAAAR